MTLDLAKIRAAFPALGDGWVPLDNAGGSQVLGAVVERIADFLVNANVQTGASYPRSQEAARRLRHARQRLALLVNAERAEEIVMGATATQLTDQLARALAPTFAPGDEVIVTDFDHESNIGPWRRLAAQGVVIREWRLDRTSGRAELADLEALLGPRTRLVACTHASNILGTLMPIGAIAERAHAAGAQLCVDGVAYAPHRAIDVRALGADYYVFSLYKTYGPHHAVLYGRHDRLLAARNINHWFYGEERLPAKLEPGNPNYELAWGSTAIVDYLIGLGTGDGERARIEDAFARIAAHEEALSDRLLGFLKSRNGVRVVGETTADRTVRVPTISFVADDKRAEAIVTAVDPHGIGIRFGDFHSKRLIESLGLAPQGGVVRVSMVHYNTIEEVDRLCAVLDRLL